VDPLAFLFSLERLGMKFGLENMERICRALDHPERSFRSIHVAGTNGKGSVTAMTSAALHAAGYRVARYTSPHLERLEERYVIGEREVSSGDLEAAARAVQQTIEALVRDGVLQELPTFFECATAIAFELFRRAGVEIAVVEVGLGGRLDATNVILPMAAAITSIDFDHEDLLGGTLEAIAREKAGIVKAGIPVVLGQMPPEAASAIGAACRDRGARCITVGDRVHVSSSITPCGTLATFESPNASLENVKLALPGRHQVRNAAVALCLLEELDALGVRVDRNAVLAGLTDARWPGRLERTTWRGAEVLLDSAHNPAGARALADYVQEIGWANISLLVGAMRDKDIKGMLDALLPRAGSVVCTTAPNPRAMPAEELASLVRTLPSAPPRVAANPDPGLAFDDACRAGTRVVAAGSIFLIGALRGILR
jgi:dihydrofolate synthase / folylpolyglutamate synthase